MKRAERRSHRQLDVLLFSAMGMTLVITAVAGDLTLRQYTGVLGAVAFGALLYRSIEGWLQLNNLERGLAFVLGWSLLVGAVWPYQLDEAHIPASMITWWAIGNRIAVLVVCILWPSWTWRVRSQSEGQ